MTMANLLRSRRGIGLVGVLIAVVVVIAVIVVVVTGKPENVLEIPPKVTVEEGLLQGEWVDSVQGKGFKYAAFRGIPYATPPVGDLRFKGPRPPQRWEGVRNATVEGSTCCQESFLGPGSEDCLYLNVYTPFIPQNNETKLPVLFNIHGGGFRAGSAAVMLAGPDFLLQHDIVIVSMNYRLGVFGFLSLDTEDAPGNAGLKDQIAALHWVRKNIRAFGGDAERITIAGQSAGSASASWLAILPETKGLIRGAILQSGSAIQNWAFNRNPLEVAAETAKVLAGKPVSDKSEMALLMKNADSARLLDASVTATSNLAGRILLGNELLFLFSPTVELREQGSEKILIKRDAESYIIKSETDDVPHLIGVTQDEGATFFLLQDYAFDDVKLKEEIDHLRVAIPISIIPDLQTKQMLGIASSTDEAEVSDTEKKLMDYYFVNASNIENCTDACKMAKYYNTCFMMADAAHFAKLRAKYLNKPTYAYLFNLKSDYNPTSDPNTPDFLKNAVNHGDDTNYVWVNGLNPTLRQDYYGTSVASLTLRRMVTFIANFVKVGNPTPEDNSWKPIEQGDEETFLEITEVLTQRSQSLSGSDSPLWSSIFSQYRRNKSP